MEMPSATFFVAAYGAVISTVALGWNILRGHADRGKLTVTAMLAWIRPGPPDDEQLVVTITNVGRRPVNVTGWMGRLRETSPNPKKGLFLIAEGLPNVLKEGEQCHLRQSDLSFLTDDLERLYVSDSTGREWDVPRDNLQNVIQQAEKGRKG